MEPFPKTFAIQVIHPQHEAVERKLGGRSFDLVVDKEEFIGGMFTTENCRRVPYQLGPQPMVRHCRTGQPAARFLSLLPLQNPHP
jgi:nicotinamidase-related amidase